MREIGPTAVMRLEHREIQALLDGITAALAGAMDSAAAVSCLMSVTVTGSPLW